MRVKLNYLDKKKKKKGRKKERKKGRKKERKRKTPRLLGQNKC